MERVHDDGIAFVFQDILYCSQFLCTVQVVKIIVSGQKDDLAARPGAQDILGQSQTVHAGHLYIRNNHIHAPHAQQGQCLGGRVCAVYLQVGQALLLHMGEQTVGDDGLIVND